MKYMRINKFKIIGLGLAAMMMGQGCGRSEGDGTDGAGKEPSQTTLNSNDNRVAGYATEREAQSSPLSVTSEGGEITIKYTVTAMDTLKGEEWPALIVFLAPTNGAAVDRRIVEAKDMRPGRAGSAIITKKFVLRCAPIGKEEALGLEGYRISIRDTERKEIAKGASFEIPLALLERQTEPGSFPPKSSYDLNELGDTMKVSAAVAAFKTEKRDFVFQRFLSSVSVQQATTETE